MPPSEASTGDSLTPTARQHPLLWWSLALLALAALGTAAFLFLRFDGLLLIAQANDWLADVLIKRLGYGGVFALMAIESSLVPFPSEIVMPPAGALARRNPDWTLLGVISAGTLGSLAGAWFNYLLARYLGRPLLLRFVQGPGRYLHLNEAKYLRAEALFLRHGAITTFLGRLIPGVRQLISLPAGLAKMNPLTFSALTALGAGIWSAVLALLGFWFAGQPEELSRLLHRAPHLVLAAVLALGTLYLAWRWYRRQRASR